MATDEAIQTSPFENPIQEILEFSDGHSVVSFIGRNTDEMVKTECLEAKPLVWSAEQPLRR